MLRIVLAVGGLGMMIPGTLTDAVGLVLVAAVIVKISAKKHGGPVVTAWTLIKYPQTPCGMLINCVHLRAFCLKYSTGICKTV